MDMKPVTMSIDKNPTSTGVQHYVAVQLRQLAQVISASDTRWGDYASSAVNVRLKFDEDRFGGDSETIDEMRRLWIKGKMRQLLDAGGEIVDLGWNTSSGMVRFEVAFGKVESHFMSPRYAIIIMLDEAMHWSMMADMLFVKNRVRRDLPDDFAVLESILETNEGEQE